MPLKKNKLKKLYLTTLCLLLLSCKSKSQEKITKLSQKEINMITKLFDKDSFTIESITKIDSSKNITTFSYYDKAFSLNRRKIKTFDKNRNIENSKEYNTDFGNKEFLPLFSEQKYAYSERSTKTELRVWRNGKEVGLETNETLYDEHNRIIESKTESESKNYHNTIIIETYKYNIDSIKNMATICKTEYSDSREPKSFENCETYHFKDGKITQNKVRDIYQYDNKNRLIREMIFDRNKNPRFEDLFIYDDEKLFMEYERYRFEKTKFLVAKKQTFYNKIGLIEKIIDFGWSQDDQLLPETVYYFIYNNDNKKILEIELKSKTFEGKLPPPPI